MLLFKVMDNCIFNEPQEKIFDDILNRIPNIYLDQLAEKENFSVRTINVCRNNGLISLHKILTYYNKNKTFLNFNACGVKTESELVNTCLRVLNDKTDWNSFIQELECNKNEYKILKKIDFSKLNKLQLHILNQYFRNRIQLLSKRIINWLPDIINEDTDFQTFYNIASTPDFTLNDLRNIGKKTEKEFFDFYEDIYALADLFCSKADEEELFRYFTYIVKKNLEVSDNILEQYKRSFLEKSFPLFHFIDFLIKERYIFSDRDLLMILSSFQLLS